MEKTVRYIFAANCFTGCLLQIYKISEIYFSYETTTYVRYENEVPLSLPALTICAEKHYFARKNILKKIFNNDTNSGLQNKTEILNF